MKKLTFNLLILFSALVIVLVLQSTNEVLVRGSRMPNISFVGKIGMEEIGKDSLKTTLIIWFHPDCNRCLYQLRQINDNLSRFNKIRIFFFTDSKIFPQGKHLGKWKNLTSASNVRFGIINRNEFKVHFGPVAYPSMFIFNLDGILKNKIYGEVKLSFLLDLLEINNVSEHENAVLNNAFGRR